MSKTDHIYMPEDHMDKLYTSDNALVRFVHNNRLDKIAEYLPKGHVKVLDCGCGEGHLIERMHKSRPGNEYHGIDIKDVALEKAKQRCRFAKFSKMDLSDIRYADESFDVITCTEVLEHIYEYNSVIAEYRRVLRKGGLLIITFPNESLWTLSRFLLRRNPVKVPDHVNSFTPKIINTAAHIKLFRQYNLPYGLPFFMSLGCLMVFKK